MKKAYKFLRYLPDAETATTAGGAILLFALLALLTVSVYLTYQVVSPPRTGTALTLENLLGNPSAVFYTVPGVGERQGWFFPGLRGAPTVILCHGYRSSRTEFLTLATALQENKYNVFLLDFSGHGNSEGMSTLGYKERKELEAAIDALALRDDVDRERFGIWGVDLGAYLALSAAIVEKRVAVVVLDSAYTSPGEMFRVQLAKSGLSKLPLVTSFCRLAFWLLTIGNHGSADLSENLAGLAGRPKLFIQSREHAGLAETTSTLYQKSPEPRQQALNEKSTYGTMLEDEKRNYDNQIVSFFLEHLSPIPRPR